MTQHITKTIQDIFAALNAAASLAHCCDSVEALENPDIRQLAVKRAAEVKEHVAKARLELTGKSDAFG